MIFWLPAPPTMPQEEDVLQGVQYGYDNEFTGIFTCSANVVSLIDVATDLTTAATLSGPPSPSGGSK